MRPWVIKLGGDPAAVVNLAQSIVILQNEGKSVVVVSDSSQMVVEVLLKNNLKAVESSMQTHEIEDALAMGFIPVITSQNMDADLVAATVAENLLSRILIYATDQRGILDLNELPYDSLTLDQLQTLMEKGGVSGGMLTTCLSIKKALLGGVAKVCVTHAMELKDLIETKQGGTLCVEMSRMMFLSKMKENEYAVC